MWALYALLALLLGTVQGQTQQRPNIVVIMADDLGFNDVSFHGSDIPTPNIDALGYHGVILNKHYAPPLCTPSRASFLTGKYPIRTGLQHSVIKPDTPFGLGLEERTMPEFFRAAGYATHLVGKWHLGFFKRAYTPTKRGFDSHFGYLGPGIDYWDHTQAYDPYPPGLDLRRNLEVNWDANGTYATRLFNDAAVEVIRSHPSEEKPLFLVVNHLAPHAGNPGDPLQAPQEEIAKFAHLPRNRSIVAAMVSLLDESVGSVVQALSDKGILNNTIILFFSDNGAPTIGIHANYGSNSPLRGQKESPWEGASRVPAVIWSPFISNRRRVSNEWFHNTDWLPTLAAAANISLPTALNLDGINQWDSLSLGSLGPRSEVLLNVNDVDGYASFIQDGLKIVVGTTFNGTYDSWLSPETTPQDIASYSLLVQNSTVNELLANLSQPLLQSDIARLRDAALVHCGNVTAPGRMPCDPEVFPCLFNLLSDPCELNNVAAERPSDVTRMFDRMIVFQTSAVPIRNQPADPAANPANFNFTWHFWQEDPVDEFFQRGDVVWILAIIMVSITVLVIAFVCGLMQLNLVQGPPINSTVLDENVNGNKIE